VRVGADAGAEEGGPRVEEEKPAAVAAGGDELALGADEAGGLNRRLVLVTIAGKPAAPVGIGVLVVVGVLPAMEVGARGARLPRERRRGVSLPLLPPSRSLLLPPAAPAAVPLRLSRSFSFFVAAFFALAAALAAPAAAFAARSASSSSPSSSADVAVGVLLRVARARLPARDRCRYEVDCALGVDGDEQAASAARLEGDAFLCFGR